jgi:hypothetical protein
MILVFLNVAYYYGQIELNVQNVLTLAFDIRDKKKEHLICPHLL